MALALYNKVTPNPTTDSVDEATALGRARGVGAVLAIGGRQPHRLRQERRHYAGLSGQDRRRPLLLPLYA